MYPSIISLRQDSIGKYAAGSKATFFGGQFLERQVSTKALWWLALAIIVRAAFKRLLHVSMKLVVCINPSSTGLSLCGSDCIVLFKIPDRFICVTLSLSGSTSICDWIWENPP